MDGGDGSVDGVLVDHPEEEKTDENSYSQAKPPGSVTMGAPEDSKHEVAVRQSICLPWQIP